MAPPRSSANGARDARIRDAYAHCRRLAAHYENFPVGSLLFPRERRDQFHAVYAFARIADDFADEGEVHAEDRLRNLDAWEHELDRGEHSTDPVFIALADTIRTCGIPVEQFRKLLSAFRQDVTITRYATFHDVMHYCDRSANPIGNIVLRLFNRFDDRTGPRADNICTALQLANFWQDVAADYAKGRIYIPIEDMRRFGVDEACIAQRAITPAFRALMRFEVERTARLFDEGAPLVTMLSGRLRTEIAWILASGREVLRQIGANDFDVLTKNNRLSGFRRVWLLARAFVRIPG